MVKNIYLIRHAQSQQNAVNNTFSGSTNTPICLEGKVQAENLRAFFKDIDVEKIISSDLDRAKETAKIIFGTEIPLDIERRLREVDFGEYEGKHFENDSFDPIYRNWTENAESLTFPGGDNMLEKAKDFYQRMFEIASEQNYETIAIVSHSASIRLFLAEVLGLSINNFRRIPCDNCSVTKLTFNGNFKISYCNFVYGNMK